MATNRRTAQTLTPADPAALAAEMAATAASLFSLLEAGENEQLWTRLVAACEADWRKSAGADLPAEAARLAAERRFYEALPEPLRKRARDLESWNADLFNIGADAGFRLGLAMGRGGAR